VLLLSRRFLAFFPSSYPLLYYSPCPLRSGEVRSPSDSILPNLAHSGVWWSEVHRTQSCPMGSLYCSILKDNNKLTMLVLDGCNYVVDLLIELKKCLMPIGPTFVSVHSALNSYLLQQRSVWFVRSQQDLRKINLESQNSSIIQTHALWVSTPLFSLPFSYTVLPKSTKEKRNGKKKRGRERMVTFYNCRFWGEWIGEKIIEEFTGFNSAALRFTLEKKNR
jgi:hypothetical protein